MCPSCEVSQGLNGHRAHPNPTRNPYQTVQDYLSNVSNFKIIESTLREGEQVGLFFPWEVPTSQFHFSLRTVCKCLLRHREEDRNCQSLRFATSHVPHILVLDAYRLLDDFGVDYIGKILVSDRRHRHLLTIETLRNNKPLCFGAIKEGLHCHMRARSKGEGERQIGADHTVGFGNLTGF